MTTLGLVDVEVVLKEAKEDEKLQKIVGVLKGDLEGKPNFQ